MLADPYEDGKTKTRLPFPYKRGTFGFEWGDFWMAYRFLNNYVLAIVAVYWNPHSRRYPLDI
ncbi:MAG: hypothetical protein HYX92_12390 [Chloroflexi bacterium]|nr:hypothetical protein [Chloroflexota bacterium]